jgi:flagellar basal-body rod protein FlgF
MISGLYMSASGVITNSHRQDVIANNLANIETNGFKRALSLVQQRPPESIESGRTDLSNPMLDRMGGGMFLSPTRLDLSQGGIEQSDSSLHMAIFGKGYFAVKDGDETRLTRNGNFMLDRAGNLIQADGSGRPVLNTEKQPIRLNPTRLAQTSIDKDGLITVGGDFAGQIGLFDVADPKSLVPIGGTLLATPPGATLQPATDGRIQSGYLESSNVDPASEMAQLLDAQRQLEANANMIRFQDQTLGKLVNEVGKIG